ncbi:MAG: HupE/UreJ family protein [Hyphomicrobiales bacterium]|nr:HupE/UreJ family protein [Hyphomicrobiales bacterium]
MRLVLFALLSLLPSVALAHPGHGDAGGLTAGFLHPLGGIDHILAMVAVGLLAARLGGRALWLVPSAFIAMMVAGGALGMAGVSIPCVETGVTMSVVVLGAAIAFELAPPVAVATALVGFFAIFHGHAHGAETPETASGLAFGAGFVLATALLHAVGFCAGLIVGLSGPGVARPLRRIAGSGAALAGLAILEGWI